MESRETQSPRREPSKTFRSWIFWVVVFVPVLALLAPWAWRHGSKAVRWAEYARDTLAQTLEHVRTQIADFSNRPGATLDRRFGANDDIRIPEMFWRIDRRFTELIGKVVANSDPPMPIVEALQTIEFRLDRCGAVVASESMLAVASSPRHFEFDHPLLVHMLKRGAERPFFVMWVDNAELLVRK